MPPAFGSSDFALQLSQVPIKIMTRHWTYPLSLHCRNATTYMRLVTRPFLQNSQMTGLSSAAIAHPLTLALRVTLHDIFEWGCVSYFTLTAESIRLLLCLNQRSPL